MYRLLAVLPLALALFTAGCSSATTPAPPPAPTSPVAAAQPPVPTTTAAPGPDLTGTRVLSPARGLFTAEVPTRFVDVDASSPEAAAIPSLQQAIRNGAGVLALDRRDGYSPTAGGFCTRVRSRDLTELATELSESTQRTGSPVEPPRSTVLPAAGPAGPRVSATYRTAFTGRDLQVQQVAGLAGPGRACVLTVSTDDPARDAAVLTTARDTFRMAG